MVNTAWNSLHTSGRKVFTHMGMFEVLLSLRLVSIANFLSHSLTHWDNVSTQLDKRYNSFRNSLHIISLTPFQCLMFLDCQRHQCISSDLLHTFIIYSLALSMSNHEVIRYIVD